MDHLSLAAELAVNSYPGRGIVIGRSDDGLRAVLAYFIMGRSANSRNRVFTEKDGGIITEAADPSKLEDPSLIIYAPVRVSGSRTIVTNGDQTDTIFEAYEKGHGFAKALRTRTFEPDAPNFTPRISAMSTLENGDFSLEMSVLKAADAEGKAALKCFYAYDGVEAGEACFIHTYTGDGSPLPSFAGEPERVSLPEGCVNCLTEAVWNALDRENRVSLWTRTVDLRSGEVRTRIVNANE